MSKRVKNVKKTASSTSMTGSVFETPPVKADEP